MLSEVAGDAGGGRGDGYVACSFDGLDSGFNLADGGEIFVDFVFVGTAEGGAEAAGVGRDAPIVTR